MVYKALWGPSFIVHTSSISMARSVREACVTHFSTTLLQQIKKGHRSSFALSSQPPYHSKPAFWPNGFIWFPICSWISVLQKMHLETFQGQMNKHFSWCARRQVAKFKCMQWSWHQLSGCLRLHKDTIEKKLSSLTPLPRIYPIFSFNTTKQ